MTVRSILDSKGTDVVSVQPGVKVSVVVNLLAEKRIGALLVMTDGRIDGIVSERDIVRVLAEKGVGVLDQPVRSIMSAKVVTCRRVDTVAAIMETMTNHKFRHLPVVEEGRLVGLISIGDVVKSRVMEYEKEQEALREYIKTA